MGTEPQKRFDAGRMFGGVLLILLGTLFMLDRAGYLRIEEFWRFWPVLLIAVGVSKMLQPPARHGKRRGIGQVIIGSWLLLNTTTALRFRTSWPLLLVAIGGYIVWEALSPQSSPRGREQ